MAAGVVYTTDATVVGHADLAGFFVDWPSPPSPERHLELLRGSDHVVLAREGEDGRIVGFVTAISDGVLSAFIPLLEVLPERQGLGIGSELVRRVLAELEGLYMVDLMCDPELQPFYERFGLTPLSGMGVRRYDVLRK